MFQRATIYWCIMEIKRSDSDKLIFRDMVKMTKGKESSWLARMCDKFIEVSYPQKRAVLTYFIELEVGPPSWERYFKDESLWMNCWGNILYYYTGREDIKAEPDQTQFLELLSEFFSSGLYLDAKEEADKSPDEAEFGDLLEDIK